VKLIIQFFNLIWNSLLRCTVTDICVHSEKDWSIIFAFDPRIDQRRTWEFAIGNEHLNWTVLYILPMHLLLQIFSVRTLEPILVTRMYDD